METIQQSSLKTKEEVISDLKNLLSLVNDGKEGYSIRLKLQKTLN